MFIGSSLSSTIFIYRFRLGLFGLIGEIFRLIGGGLLPNKQFLDLYECIPIVDFAFERSFVFMLCLEYSSSILACHVCLFISFSISDS